MNNSDKNSGHSGQPPSENHTMPDEIWANWIPADHEIAPVRVKTCEKCAFKKGSEERQDPYGFAMRIDDWLENGAPHYCHENVPGHRQEKKDGSPRWMKCCSAERFKHKGIDPMKLVNACLKEEGKDDD